MSFPKKMIEWRQLDAAQSWHLFFGNKSICGRETSNGHFNFAEKKPAGGDKTCKLCLKESTNLASRMKEVI